MPDPEHDGEHDKRSPWQTIIDEVGRNSDLMLSSTTTVGEVNATISADEPNAFNVPNVPGADVLVDAKFGARGHGFTWREEHQPDGLTDAQLLQRAALLRLIGPLKRAWEYPTLLDRFRKDPAAYLAREIGSIDPHAVEGRATVTNDFSDSNIQVQLEDDGGGALIDETKWKGAGNETEQVQACANELLKALQVLANRLQLVTGNECK